MSMMKMKMAALVFALAGFAAGDVQAADVRFEVLNQPVIAGHGVEFYAQAVSAGKPVAGASVTKAKLHMLMGSMDMPMAVTILSPGGQGAARFSADLTMFGEWTLDVTATVPGESAPVVQSVKFQVAK